VALLPVNCLVGSAHAPSALPAASGGGDARSSLLYDIRKGHKDRLKKATPGNLEVSTTT
jgi:hypothetical protein